MKYLMIALLIGCFPPSATQGDDAATSARPNILWITIDDCGPDFGCYGNDLVDTPNLDQLAARGQRFTNSFVTTPVCSPVRSSLITGCYAPTIGAHQHRSTRELPPGIVPITDLLKAHGYRCTKLPAKRVGVDDFLAGVGAGQGEFLTLTGRAKFDFNFRRGQEKDYLTNWDSTRKNEPFFAMIDFNPQKGPARWGQDYAEKTGTTIDRAAVPIYPYWPDIPEMRDRVARYHQAITTLDAEVGKVLDWLNAEDLLDKTLVFVWADHGMAFFRHKQWCYDSGLRVPLLVAGPGVEAGIRNDLVSSIDLAATTLAACGISLPEYMAGHDFLNVGAAPRKYVFASRDRCDETEDRVRAVRDQRFKLIHNFDFQRAYAGRNEYTRKAFLEVPILLAAKQAGTLSPIQAIWLAETKPEWEFYDLAKDPMELVNLIDAEEFAPEIARLQIVLDEWVAQVDADNPFPEQIETIIPKQARDLVIAQRRKEAGK